MSAPGAAREIALSVEAVLARKVRVAALAAGPVAVVETAGQLQREIDQAVRELRERFCGRAPADIDELKPARELYRAFGIDPTKTRPSSEKLLRRVLSGKPLPRISSAVDLGNLLALRFLLPIGLFDAACIEGAVELRPGFAGESYAGIGSQEVHLGGRPVLADRRGAFGNPTADSKRTAVQPGTRALWMTVFAPASVPRSWLEAHLEIAAVAFTRHLAATDALETRSALVPGQY